MTFEDIGIAVCSCGVERRLYKPDTGPDACLPCIQKRHARRLSVLDDGRRDIDPLARTAS